MPVTELEVRHGERPVDGGVECDGDDHEKSPRRSWTVRVAYQRSAAGEPWPRTERRRRAAVAEHLSAHVDLDGTEPSCPFATGQSDGGGRHDPLDHGAVGRNDADERLRGAPAPRAGRP